MTLSSLNTLNYGERIEENLINFSLLMAFWVFEANLLSLSKFLTSYATPSLTTTSLEITVKKAYR